MSGMPGTKGSMRGLTVFISEIRNTSTKEEEESKINKEMAKIRKKFKEAGAKLSGYDRRKYVSKILYMYLLGYEPDFGYMEAINLISSSKYAEKQMGYVTLGVVLHEEHEMIPLIINSLRQDLESRSEVHASLALAAVCNIGGKSMAESLTPVVQRLLVSAASTPMVKKKAAMCMLRLQQKFPAIVSPDEWRSQLSDMLAEPDLGIMTAYMSFVNALAKTSPESYAFLYSKVVAVMTKIVVGKRFTRDYIYYRVPCPWLQVKCLKFLQSYPPPQDSQLLGTLHDVLSRIIASADSVKGQKDNSKNAYNAVLFECVSLIIHLNTDVSLLRETAALLGKLLADRGSNLRYLGLELMNKLAIVLNSQMESGQSNKSGMNFQEYQETVTMALQDPDISIRRRALDLLYGMCSRKTSRSIVLELLGYLQSLNINLSADIAIREELVLKIAILAEKYAPSNKWYVDVMLKLITIAGDVMSDEIWFRVIKIVTNHPEIQEYATRTMFQAMASPQCNETTVRIAGYLLGEYGNLVANDPQMSPERQTQLTLSKLATSSEGTRAMLLSTFIKFVNIYPEVTQRILPIFRAHAQYLNAEIQQRAVEYFNLATLGDDKLLETVCDVMPAFGEITDEVEDEDVSQDNVPIANLLEQTKMRQEQYQLQYMNDEASDDDEGLNRGDDEDELSARNYGAAGAMANSMYPGNPLYSQQQQGGLNLNNLTAEERQSLMLLIQMQQQGMPLTPQQQQLLQQLMMKASMQTQYSSPTSTVSSSSSPVNSPYNSQQGGAPTQVPQVTQPLAGLTLEQTAQLQQLLALQQQLQAQGQQLSPMQQQLLQQMINVHMTAKQLQSGVATTTSPVPAPPPQPLPGSTSPLASTTQYSTQLSTSPSTGAAPTMIVGMNKPVFGGGTYDITREFEGVIRLAKGDPTELQRQQVVQEEKRKANFRRLCLRNEGVLYEDNVVQIGFKSEYQQGQGRLALFFGNKTQQPLSNFSASAASTPQLNVTVTQKEAPAIEPMSQNKLFLTLTCLAPFTESSYPLLNVNFVSQGRPMSIKHELPVNIAKFIDPVPLDSTAFFQQWKQTGTGQEAQEVFKAALSVNVPNISKLLSIGLRLAVLSDVDTNVNNIVCSGQCYTQLGPVACLARLETNPTANMIRMTVKSNNTQLTEAVKQLVMAHLAVSAV